MQTQTPADGKTEPRPVKTRGPLPVVGYASDPPVTLLTPEQLEEAMFGPIPDELLIKK